MHRILLVPLVALLLALTATVAAGQNPVAVPPEQIQAYLKGYKEVPAVSTHASGEFRAELYATELYYELTYADIEAPATVASSGWPRRESEEARLHTSAEAAGNQPALSITGR